MSTTLLASPTTYADRGTKNPFRKFRTTLSRKKVGTSIFTVENNET